MRVPIDSGRWFKTRDSWPRAARLYCQPLDDPPRRPDIIEEAEVSRCAWRGAAIDLVLARPNNSRAQFVFTKFRGRQMVLWQTAKAVLSARPGVRVPGRRLPVASLLVHIDTRERYPYRFAGRGLVTNRKALRVGDYAVSDGDEIVAAVERKTFEDFAKGLSDGSLGFVMSHLASLRAGAVVVEGTYSQLLRHPFTRAGWLADLVAAVQVRYRTVPLVFAESRKLAEEWTVRFLAAAFSEARDSRLPLERAWPSSAGRRRSRKRPTTSNSPKLMSGAELLESLRERARVREDETRA